MGKLKFDLNDLKVESFDTQPAEIGGRPGTVFGYDTFGCTDFSCGFICSEGGCGGSGQPNTCAFGCTGDDSCGGTCSPECISNASCEGTCFENTCDECGATNDPTCWATCAATCAGQETCGGCPGDTDPTSPCICF